MHTLKIITDAATLEACRHSANLEDEGASSYCDADGPYCDSDSDMDSLFDGPFEWEGSPLDMMGDEQAYVLNYVQPPPPIGLRPAMRTAPPVQGLYFDPFALLPDDLAETLLQKCIGTYFREEGVNQVMLFERVFGKGAGGMCSSHRK